MNTTHPLHHFRFTNFRQTWQECENVSLNPFVGKFWKFSVKESLFSKKLIFRPLSITSVNFGVSVLRLPVITTHPRFKFWEDVDASPLLADSCSGFWAPMQLLVLLYIYCECSSEIILKIDQYGEDVVSSVCDSRNYVRPSLGWLAKLTRTKSLKAYGKRLETDASLTDASRPLNISIISHIRGCHGRWGLYGWHFALSESMQLFRLQ